MTVLSQFGFAATKDLDPLTRLYTRQRLYEFLLSQQGKISLELPTTFVIFRIRHLSHYNTLATYETGDAIISCVAQVIQNYLPAHSQAGRWNGTEIGVVVPFADPGLILPWCEMVEKTIKDLAVPFNLPKYLKNIELFWSLAASPPQQLSFLPQQVENQLKEISWQKNYNIQHFFSSKNQEVFNQKVLLLLLQQKSPHLKEHTIAATYYSEKLGEKLELNQEQMINLRTASLWQNIGLVKVPLYKLIKPEPISLEDKIQQEKHPLVSAEWANSLGVSQDIQKIIAAHHESWNGKGYPLGLKEHAIPLEARILNIAHSFTENMQRLSWRKSLNLQESLNNLKAGSGICFDPALIEIFCQMAQNLPSPKDIYQLYQGKELKPTAPKS